VIDGASSAVIKLPNGAFFLIEGLLTVDKEKDIALLKAYGRDFPTVPFVDSVKFQVGEDVVSIGSPLSGEASVSNGIISSIRDQESEVHAPSAAIELIAQLSKASPERKCS
jgi:S1-C subfamily serine protease